MLVKKSLGRCLKINQAMRWAEKTRDFLKGFSNAKRMKRNSFVDRVKRNSDLFNGEVENTNNEGIRKVSDLFFHLTCLLGITDQRNNGLTFNLSFNHCNSLCHFVDDGKMNALQLLRPSVQRVISRSTSFLLAQF